MSAGREGTHAGFGCPEDNWGRHAGGILVTTGKQVSNRDAVETDRPSFVAMLVVSGLSAGLYRRDAHSMVVAVGSGGNAVASGGAGGVGAEGSDRRSSTTPPTTNPRGQVAFGTTKHAV